jgi:hypothetical protein
MTINSDRPSSFMAQRLEPEESDDFFPTPPWATRAIVEQLLKIDPALASRICWEPACGEGHMSRPLAETFRKVISTDLVDYGFGERRDFLAPSKKHPRADWIVTNPPFKLTQDFVLQALELARVGVAMFARVGILETVDRYESIFLPRPPVAVYQFVERVPLHKGRVVMNGRTASQYLWVVWLKASLGGETVLRWIAPCRKRLTKPGDYGEAVQIELEDAIAASSSRKRKPRLAIARAAE